MLMTVLKNEIKLFAPKARIYFLKRVQLLKALSVVYCCM